jgi:hypothetical protein
MNDLTKYEFEIAYSEYFKFLNMTCFKLDGNFSTIDLIKKFKRDSVSIDPYVNISLFEAL